MKQEFENMVGAWRLISFSYTFVDTGERVDVFGPNPDGYMVLSQSGRVMFLFGARDQPSPQNDADRVSLFNQMYGYTGLIRSAGPNSFATSIDYSWNPAWSGDQLRHFKLEGDKLLITTPEQLVPAHGARLIVGDVLWVREGS
jgi:hypothetical protein